MLSIPKCFILLLFSNYAVSQECYSYDFEEGFYELFENNGLCSNILDRWQLGAYSELGIKSPHALSTQFISPGVSVICVSYHMFEMEGGGVLEVNIYTEAVLDTDQVIVMVKHIVPGVDKIAGSLTVYPVKQGYTDGWHTLAIPLSGTGNFSGYINFMGMASQNSILLIDSFRYTPPSSDEDPCNIYDDDDDHDYGNEGDDSNGDGGYSNEDIGNDESDSEEITNEPENSCVTYDFEDDFDALFSNKGACNNLVSWEQGNYFSIDIESPNANSFSFITPTDDFSCVSSFPFLMSGGGVIHVILYKNITRPHDFISIMAYEIVPHGTDAITGVISTLTSISSDSGWYTYSGTLLGSDSYKGYLSFTGSKANESILLVDSFRYVPPSLPDKECYIYVDDDYEETTAVAPTVEPTGDACVTFDFEEDFELFSNNGSCHNLEPWILGNYSWISIQRPHPNSNHFMAPSTIGFSCMSSFYFSMVATGVIEVAVYLDPTMANTLSILVFDNDDAMIGIISRQTLSDDSGWYTYRGSIMGSGQYEGHISFMGMAAHDSYLLIDSFRYIPPSLDEKQCSIYDDGLEETTLQPELTTINPKTTTIPPETTTAESETTTVVATTEEPTTVQPGESCVTYNFEEYFDEVFHKNGSCTNLEPWTLGNYSYTSIDSPHPLSNLFMSPSDGFSCVSTFDFTMAASGVIEVKVFLSASSANVLTIMVFERVSDGTDAFVGSISRQNPVNPIENSGWYLYKGSLMGSGYYNGYITFMGLAAHGSYLLIDSFRYIPPSFTEENCPFYEEYIETTTTKPEECVAFNLEENFDELFTHGIAVCSGFVLWDLGHYSEIPIQRPNPNSTSFITPRDTSSCMSTFYFSTSAGGVVEVKVYMEPTTLSDHIIILVNARKDDGHDAVVGVLIYTPSDMDFVVGWNTLRINVAGTGTFDTYISFMGSAAENSIVLVDSFRYIPPAYDQEECKIYEYDPDVTSTPIETDTTTDDVTFPNSTESDSTSTDMTTPTATQTETDFTSTDSPTGAIITTTPTAGETYYTITPTIPIITDDITETDQYPITDPITTKGTEFTSTTELISTTTAEITKPSTNETTEASTTEETGTITEEIKSTITGDAETPSATVTESSTTETPDTSTETTSEWWNTTTDSLYPTTELEIINPPSTTPDDHTKYTTPTEPGTNSPTEMITDDSTVETPSISTDSATMSTLYTTPEEETFTTTSLETTTWLYNTTTTESTDTNSTLLPLTTPDDLDGSESTTIVSAMPTPSTEKPIIDDDDPDKEFWIKILIIVLIVLIVVIYCVFHSFCCYELGARKAHKYQPPAINIVNNTGDREFKFWKYLSAQRDINRNRILNNSSGGTIYS